jgi:hypothetical protein
MIHINRSFLSDTSTQLRDAHPMKNYLGSFVGALNILVQKSSGKFMYASTLGG